MQSQSPKNLSYEDQKTHFNVYIERQKAQNSQYNVEEEHSWRIDYLTSRLTIKLK